MFNTIAPIAYGERCFTIRAFIRDDRGMVVGEVYHPRSRGMASAIYRERRGHRYSVPTLQPEVIYHGA